MVTNPKAGPSVLFKLALLKRFVNLFEKVFVFSGIGDGAACEQYQSQWGRRLSVGV